MPRPVRVVAVSVPTLFTLLPVSSTLSVSRPALPNRFNGPAMPSTTPPSNGIRLPTLKTVLEDPA